MPQHQKPRWNFQVCVFSCSWAEQLRRHQRDVPVRSSEACCGPLVCICAGKDSRCSTTTSSNTKNDFWLPSPVLDLNPFGHLRLAWRLRKPRYPELFRFKQAFAVGAARELLSLKWKSTSFNVLWSTFLLHNAAAAERRHRWHLDWFLISHRLHSSVLSAKWYEISKENAGSLYSTKETLPRKLSVAFPPRGWCNNNCANCTREKEKEPCCRRRQRRQRGRLIRTVKKQQWTSHGLLLRGKSSGTWESSKQTFSWH